MAALARRHRSRTLLAAGGAVLIALAVSGCGSADASDAPVETKSFPFKGETLTVDTVNAAVELVPADVKDVEVTRQVDGWVFMGSGPDASWKMTDNTLSLKVKCRAVASNCESLHKVKVPRGVAVTLKGDNGRVTAGGFTTALKLTSDNGALTVRDSSGPIDLETDNGKITTEGVSAKTVAAKSSNGAIRLGLTAVPDRVDTTTDNGRIDIDLPSSDASYAVTTSTDNGSVDVGVRTDKSSAHVVKARTSNGKITIQSAN
ncbi:MULTISPECIES: DUF4097 family beta strand repeat-containing protein [unclassified Streptomyces]|uniref:DUF4097 family beta strand repeat-containing protein n=1 Tax=unclassified Streptomyces TaxID=2593676 RepID=UPI00343CDF3B